MNQPRAHRIVIATAVLLLAAVVVPGRTAGAVLPIEVERCSAGRVALTFDDGPSPTVTPELVRLLRERHVPATFFMVGSRVRSHPEVARLVSEAGFAVGNHTFAHHDLTTLTREQIRSGLRATRRALHAAGVEQVTRHVRPPYGAIDDRVRDVLARRHLTPVLWNVDSRDWDGLTAPAIRRTTIAQVRDRGTTDSVVLHHDGVANSAATLAALPGEIHRLRAAGYCFVPLRRLAPDVG